MTRRGTNGDGSRLSLVGEWTLRWWWIRIGLITFVIGAFFYFVSALQIGFIVFTAQLPPLLLMVAGSILIIIGFALPKARTGVRDVHRKAAITMLKGGLDDSRTVAFLDSVRQIHLQQVTRGSSEWSGESADEVAPETIIQSYRETLSRERIHEIALDNVDVEKARPEVDLAGLQEDLDKEFTTFLQNTRTQEIAQDGH